MINEIKLQKTFLGLLIVSFAGFTLWWLVLLGIGKETPATNIFAATYWVVALMGGLFGLYAAKVWGYFKSHLGRATILLSLGLLLNVFGQVTFSYYTTIANINLPYPSIADIGYFGAVPCYILAAFFLAKGLDVKAIVAKNKAKLLLGIVVPLIVLSVSYMFFLKDYSFTDKTLLAILLDFAYPLGQAAYVSIVFVILLSLGRLIGGTMKVPLLLLLLAFILQYAADFNFLYQASQETWNGGGYGDYLYLLAYFMMGLSLMALTRSLHKMFKANSFAEKVK